MGRKATFFDKGSHSAKLSDEGQVPSASGLLVIQMCSSKSGSFYERAVRSPTACLFLTRGTEFAAFIGPRTHVESIGAFASGSNGQSVFAKSPARCDGSPWDARDWHKY